MTAAGEIVPECTEEVLRTQYILSLIISSMKDKFGKITVDGFYDDVIDLTVEDRHEIAKVPFDEDDYCKSVGAPEAFANTQYPRAAGHAPHLN